MSAHFFPAISSRAQTATSTGRNSASTATASGTPIQPAASIASRPASHSPKSAASGGPDSGICPVQFGIAVIRNPASTAGAKPNSISCPCQATVP